MWNSSFRSLSRLWSVVVRQPGQPIILSKRNSSFTRAHRLEYVPSVSSNTIVRLVNGKGIDVEWGESEEKGREDYFHGVWLRHNCHCPLCLDADANQNIVDSAQLNNPSVTHAVINGKY